LLLLLSGWLPVLLLLLLLLVCCSMFIISVCCCPIFSASFEARAKLVVARTLVRDSTSWTDFFSCMQQQQQATGQCPESKGPNNGVQQTEPCPAVKPEDKHSCCSSQIVLLLMLPPC
jgi:hypothetical protein